MGKTRHGAFNRTFLPHRNFRDRLRFFREVGRNGQSEGRPRKPQSGTKVRIVSITPRTAHVPCTTKIRTNREIRGSHGLCALSAQTSGIVRFVPIVARCMMSDKTVIFIFAWTMLAIAVGLGISTGLLLSYSLKKDI